MKLPETVPPYEPGEKLKSIEKLIELFPPLSSTVASVLKVTADPNTSANDLMEAILPDQAMCVAILKIANSVIYGRPRKVSSLENAIVVLGFNEVRNIVLGKAAVQSSQKLFRTYRYKLYSFWKHSFTCGLAARIIAEHLNIPSGQFFIGGLLHDIGKLAMLLAFETDYETEQWFESISTEETLRLERELFTVTHDRVGAKLLERWQFPETLVSCVRFHHSPELAVQQKGYALIIQAADFLARMHAQMEILDEQELNESFRTQLPLFKEQWLGLKLPWEKTTLESWFAWLKVDREHGSSVLDMLVP